MELIMGSVYFSRSLFISHSESTTTDGEGFEPSVPCSTHAFQACPIDRSGTHPGRAVDIPASKKQFQLVFYGALATQEVRPVLRCVRGPSGLIERLNERIKFGLELALPLLDNFQLQLVAMQLDGRVMNVTLDFGQLGLALPKRPLQLVLPPIQFIRRAPLKMEFLRRGIPGGLNRLGELGRGRLQKLKRRSVILRHRQRLGTVRAIDFHPRSIHINRKLSPTMRTIEDNVPLGHLHAGGFDLIRGRNAFLGAGI
jgi:hypothetical protein